MREKFLIWLAGRLPRSLCYWAGVRILSEISRVSLARMSSVDRKIYAGHVRMLHALESFINRRDR